MNKYLVISTVGDESLHKEWIKDSPNFDLVLIYYGNNPNKISQYREDTENLYISKGEKYHLIKAFIQSNLDFINKYKYIWLPDDDVSISTFNINKFFSISEQYNLLISQPSMKGYISHEITKPHLNVFLRYTNFVEILAPLFNIDSLILMYKHFDINYSGWGYEYLWNHILGYPKDKIAIIDEIIMEHVRPIGQDYSRFLIHPWDEMSNLISYYNIYKQEITYSEIIQN